MPRFPDAAVLAAGLACLAVGGWGLLPRKQEPTLRFGATFDGGELEYGKEVERPLRIENRGSVPRTILGVRATCGELCASGSNLPLPIAAGQSAELSLRLVTGNAGSLKHETELYTDEPGYGIRSLTINAHGLPLVPAVPDAVKP